jgi:cytochrome oxidase Cu insertion factor (SCO1/SenC/PrrC family)
VTPAAVAAAVKPAAAAQPQAVAAPITAAKIGEPAPDFTLSGIDGKSVTLSSFKGKTVVLEWFNPHCPFVNLSHTKGSLVDTAARHMKEGVVWLAINSAAPGKEGYGLEANLEGQKKFNLTHPILIDEDGKVGHAYGAKHTPHLFVINAEGVLVYHGAPDNSPDAEGASPTGGRLINYIDAALADLAAKRPVAIPESEAYGCGVKYGAS